jgi:sulfatase maturation enzyme AslB (radical SAM superfamily)
MLASSVVAKATSLRRLMAPGPQMPVYLLMFVTNRCNATCGHCFYWRELNTKVRQELSVEEFDKLARGMGPMLQVTFTGGSPELRKDLLDVVERFYEHCRPTNMTFCMLGHSTDRIISQAEDMLRRCPGQKLKFAMSLDGIGEEHDRLRGIPICDISNTWAWRPSKRFLPRPPTAPAFRTGHKPANPRTSDVVKDTVRSGGFS